MVRILLVVSLAFSFSLLADPPKNHAGTLLPSMKPLLPFGSHEDKVDRKVTGNPRAADEQIARYLASGDTDEDMAHYHNLTRRLGVDIGMLIPMGEFQNEFSQAPSIGIHFSWEAIPPFSFIVSTKRASSPHKDGAASGKLTVSTISIGTQAAFPMKRFIPYIKLEGAFIFNDVHFGSQTGKTVISGNDTTLTTVGFSGGVGVDFVVGREVSLGIEGLYTYSVPKKITLGNSSIFDLGSSFATVGLRVNF